jgi:hypothetical protein
MPVARLEVRCNGYAARRGGWCRDTMPVASACTDMCPMPDHLFFCKHIRLIKLHTCTRSGAAIFAGGSLLFAAPADGSGLGSRVGGRPTGRGLCIYSMQPRPARPAQAPATIPCAVFWWVKSVHLALPHRGIARASCPDSCNWGRCQPRPVSSLCSWFTLRGRAQRPPH